jgi:hypothetical protein
MNEVEVQGRETTPEQVAASATAPARWLLDTAGNGGVPLAQTNALARIVVREAAERWPDWWNDELFGPPHREMDMALLEALREGLLRMRLVRRRGRKLPRPPGDGSSRRTRSRSYMNSGSISAAVISSRRG